MVLWVSSRARGGVVEAYPLVPDDDPRKRLRYIVSKHPITRLSTATVRLMQTDLMTIRIDLNGADA